LIDDRDFTTAADRSQLFCEIIPGVSRRKVSVAVLWAAQIPGLISLNFSLRGEGGEAVKKSTTPVILSAAKNLQLFVFRKINADASRSLP
jgi:hypothetical protein